MQSYNVTITLPNLFSETQESFSKAVNTWLFARLNSHSTAVLPVIVPKSSNMYYEKKEQ